MAFELVVYLRSNNESLGGDARLAVVEGPRAYGGLNRFIQIGTWHHNKRVAATEFQHYFLDLLTLLGFGNFSTSCGRCW